MTLVFQPADEPVFDGLETVQLRSPDGETSTTIPRALRRRGERREVDPSRGTCLSAEVRWHLPVSETPLEPLPGATIVDADGETWTVLSVARTTLGLRFVCDCRNLAIAGGLNEYVRLERADWSADEHGAPTATWHVAGPPLRARLQPLAAAAGESHEQSTLRRRYRIYLAETIPLDASARLVHGGVPFRVTSYERPERIDELFVVEVEECVR